MTELLPLHDQVVVRPKELAGMTQAGFHRPDTVAKEKPMEGEVVAVGPGKRGDDGERVPMDVKVGDRVCFKKYAPDEFELEKDDTVLLLAESDILAIVKGEESTQEKADDKSIEEKSE